MSWLWRDELRLLLTPRRVYLQRRARGARPMLVEQQAVEVAGASPFDWAESLATLAELLKGRPRRAADVTVVLSNHFVRYTLVPSSDLLVTHEDELRFAQQDFARIYGAAAEGWQVCVSDGGEVGASVASGIPSGLVEGLRATLVAHGLRPRSLQPALMAAFNAARPALPAGPVRLLVVEPGMAVSALLAPGWRRIRSQRIGGDDGIEHIIQRERVLDDAPVEAEAICVQPVLPRAVARVLGDGTALNVLDPLWTLPATVAADAEARAA